MLDQERRHSSLAERERLGPVLTLDLVAPSLVLAHAELGRRVRKPARQAIAARLAKTAPDAFAVQIRCVRSCRTLMAARSADRRVPMLVRRGLSELLACVEAWGDAAGVLACVDGGEGRRPVRKSTSIPNAIDGVRLSSAEVALWAQDDNAGCQTGMLRRRDGSILAWHTEEDTIGFLDRPRLARFAVVGAEELYAFIYPYLLPGPAFGWSRTQFHAIDSLHTRRIQPVVGVLSGMAAWLVWRIGPALAAREVLRALAPFIDGCAIHVVSNAAGGVTADSHEIAAQVVKSRHVAARAGSVSLQVNAVSEVSGPLAREEEMRPRSRVLYERRLERMRASALSLARGLDGGSPEAVLRMLSSRRGGTYAYANADVKAHAVAIVSKDDLEVHVGSGPAHRADAYRPQRILSAPFEL